MSSLEKCLFTFFSYSGTWIMACLLVKYHQVVEHFSTRKEMNPNYSIRLPVFGVKVRMGVVEHRLSKCVFVA